MNLIKCIRLEICWRRGHRLYLGHNPYCATCADRKKEVKDAENKRN